MIKNLFINFTDRVQCTSDWSWNSDENGWNGFHIWCVDGGGAQIKVGNEEYYILPDDVFLFDLSTNHICTHDPRNPLRVTTIYFSCVTLEHGSKIIRQDSFLCEAIRRGVRYEQLGEKQMAQMWLHAAIYEIFQKKELKKEIPECVIKACSLIQEAFPEMPSLEELSRKTGYSQNQLIRLFSRSLNITPIQYAIKKKMEYAKGMLMYSNKSVAEIAYNTGYIDVSYFSKVFKKSTGCTPNEYRKFIWKKE